MYFMQIFVLLLIERIKGPYTAKGFYATVRNWALQLSAPYVIIIIIIIFSYKVCVMVMLVSRVEFQLRSFSISSLDGDERR
jgi:small-conductance mechanosensitive channel